MPTWFTIRASKDGYVARKRESEVLIALNPGTAREDVLALPSGGVAIYEEYLDLKQYRDDVVFYPVPFDKLTAALCPEAKLRKLVKNMVYVGVVAQLLRIDLESGRKVRAKAVRQKAKGLREQDVACAARGLPKIVIISVDLPAPLAPIRATISPGLIEVDAFQRLDLAVGGAQAADREQRRGGRRGHVPPSITAIASCSSAPR